MNGSIALSYTLNNTPRIIFIGSAVLQTLFLFYIDEGYYNFMWMSQPGNWIVFGIYVFVLFIGQFLCSELLRLLNKDKRHTILSILGGSTVALLVLISVIFSGF